MTPAAETALKIKRLEELKKTLEKAPYQGAWKSAMNRDRIMMIDKQITELKGGK